jgi:hypothetical protein
VPNGLIAALYYKFNKSPATILLLSKFIMGSAIHSKVSTVFHSERSEQVSLWKNFLVWCDTQQENRFMWMALIIVGHSTFITVITILAITYSGNHFIYWPAAIGGLMACLVVNIAGQPTRITIPVFFVSIIIDVVIIVLCTVNGFDISSSYR